MATCKRGHVGAERYASSGTCKECHRESMRTPEAMAANRARRRARHPHIRDGVLERQRVYRATPKGRALQIMQGVVKRSKKRGTSVEIDADWIQSRLEAGVCEISGLEFRYDFDGLRGPYTPSLDRIDSAKGYAPDNCRVILWALNTAFSWWGEGDMRDIASAWLGVTRDRVLVPREPTDDMVFAGMDAYASAQEAMRVKKQLRRPITETYAAMIAATEGS